MLKRMPVNLRNRLVIAVTAVFLIGGVLALHGGQVPITGQRGVVPHLVPDTGGLHAGSQGSSSASKSEPGIHLIPSAGAPVKAYGGSPSGATFVPVKHRN